MSDIQWSMANGSTLNFSEDLEKLDSVMLYGGVRDGGKSWNTLQEYKFPANIKYDGEIYRLTQPEKKASIKSSVLLVKLIGRIYED